MFVRKFLWSVLACLGAISLACSGLRAEDQPAPAFQRNLELQGIQFSIKAGAGKLEIVPRGLTRDNSPISVPLQGTVINAEVADLNSDGSPEVYVYVVLPGAERRGQLVAYSANRKMSLTPIFLPDLPKRAAKRYRGGDEFATVESTFVRRFPLSKGKTRQLQYKLRAGEAGWVLRLNRQLDF